jgi:hypothetical protein
MKLALALVVLAGCGKKMTAESCGPLTVTVDGQPLAAMPHGVARANVMNGDTSYEVEVFNHDKTTCEQLLSKTGREIPDGEVSVRAFAGGDGLMGKGVGIGAHTQAGGDVELVSAKPKAVGDVVSICVSETTFTPKIGDHKDKKIVFKGLVSGKYCGEMKF